MDKTAFLTPSPEFKSQPLWHMNGSLEKAEIERQLSDARDKSGFSGVAVLPVRETRPEYMSEEYFLYYRHILDTCRSLGMTAIFYDDIGFPSGTAGGRARERYAEHMRQSLEMVTEDVVGPASWSKRLPAGKCMAVVAMNNDTRQRRGIVLDPGAEEATWKVPAGSWKVMIFTCRRDDSDFIDYLSAPAVDAFVKLTYDEYYRRFPEHFGTTIKMTFFDDVNLRRPHCRAWTPCFNEGFKAETGMDPSLLYPALWFDIGPETAAARAALFSFRAKLFAENFTKRIRRWAADHGVKCSGHAMEQYAEQPTFLAGDNILFYKYSDIPMMDSIHYYGRGRPGFKFTSSAACTYDKPLTAVEIYGNYRDNFDTDMLYRSGMELFARGANLILPHGMWYNPENVRIKPLISEYNPVIAADLQQYNQWVGRCSLLLRGGRPVVDIGVLYPVAALHAHASLDAAVDQPDNPASVHPNAYVPPECDLYMLSDSLTGGARRDFTFLHPEVLDEKCEVRDRRLKLHNRINQQTYKIVIIPGCRVIHRSNLEKIKAFYDGGGTVIATTCLPSQSAEMGEDRNVVRLISDMFAIDPGGSQPEWGMHAQGNERGGQACFVPAFKQNRETLTDVLNDLAPDADVRFAEVPPTIDPKRGMLSYLHKFKDGRNIYFFANSTEAEIETTVTLRGRRCLEHWDPHTGYTIEAKTDVFYEDDSPYTQTIICLDPLRTLFLVETVA